MLRAGASTRLGVLVLTMGIAVAASATLAAGFGPLQRVAPWTSSAGGCSSVARALRASTGEFCARRVHRPHAPEIRVERAVAVARAEEAVAVTATPREAVVPEEPSGTTPPAEQPSKPAIAAAIPLVNASSSSTALTTPSPEPPPPPSPPPPPLFASAMESPSFAGWHLQSLPERAKVVSGSAFQGEADTRFEVREGDVEPETGSNRSEVSGPTFEEGEDLYVRDAIRVPAENSFNGPWQLIQQLHETDWSGSPGLAVFLDSNRVIKLGAGDGSPSFWLGPQLENGRWYDLVYRVHLSQEPSQGFVEVWLDGAQQTLRNNEFRYYGQTMQAPTTYLKAGIYRDPASIGTSVVEHDQVVVGTTLASVLDAPLTALAAE